MKTAKFFILGATLSVLGLQQITNFSTASRAPASSPENYVLEVKSLIIEGSPELQAAIGSDLRATFNRTQQKVLSKLDQDFFNKSSAGELSLKVNIDPEWIKDDKLEFKIEVVKPGLIDQVIVRCAQVSKKISEYNRSYQCSLPEAETAFLTYRLSKETDLPRPLAKAD